MVFSSIPIYSDPPNWPQPQVEVSSETSQLPPRPLPYGGGGGGGGEGGSTGLIRQVSMTERARLANIPQPEVALKCPRCESTNTKFCYYNNYSLSQPRHFCKTCKRYWTKGGGLRNVPVGGGCRRNKRRKSSSNIRTKSSSNSSSNGSAASNSCTQDIMGVMVPPPLQVPIFPPLQSIGEYNSSGVGLNFTRIHPPSEAVNGGGGSILYSDQWRFQQFPPLANLELPLGGLSLLEGEGIDHQSQNYIGEHKSKQFEAGVTQNSNVGKIEENQGLNLGRNSLGVHGNEQYWEANAWSTDLPGFAPHLL